MENYPDLEILNIKNEGGGFDLGTHPNFFQFPCSSMHIASTKGGKGTTLINMLFNPNFGSKGKPLIEILDEVYLFSSTGLSGDLTMKPFTENYPQNVITEYSDSRLQQILDNQLSVPKKNRPKIAIIFDDIGGWKINRNSLLFSLCTQSRHYNVIWVHYLLQKYKYAVPALRTNCTYMLISKITNQKELQDIEDEIAGRWQTGKFRECLEEATKEPYNFLYAKVHDFKPSLWKNFTTLMHRTENPGMLKISDNVQVTKFSNEKEDEKNIKKKIVDK